MHTPKNGTPASMAARATVSSPLSRRARAQAPKAPTPGSTTASAASTSAGSVTRRAAAPTCCRAFSADRRLPMP